MNTHKDYKIDWIRHDGAKTVQVNFFKGDVVTETEPNPERDYSDPEANPTADITRYRRRELIKTCKFSFDPNTSLEDIQIFLNKELSSVLFKGDTLTVINEQQV